MSYENVEFTRHCQTCAKLFRETVASMRFCSIICEESITDKNKKCPNCGIAVVGNSRKEFCSRNCKRAHNKRKCYLVKGSYDNSRRVGDAASSKEWLERKIGEKKKECVKRGIKFDIVESDLVLVSHCPILGVEIKYPPHKFKDDPNASPSIDRIIPSLGYVSGNVRIISFRANSLKNSATAEEAILLAVDALKYLPSDHPWHLQPPWE